MLYFSYNDFLDCTENGKIPKIERVQEKIARYELKNGTILISNDENQIIKILRDKIQLKTFLKEFLNLTKIGDMENIIYCNQSKTKTDRKDSNNITCKIQDKEMFIFIKVINQIDSNISYKMFEHSLNIIKKWGAENKLKSKRYPIVIPIVIYIGKEKWKENKTKNNKVQYMSYEKNKINFSYNAISTNNFKSEDLKKMSSEIAKEFIRLKK